MQARGELQRRLATELDDDPFGLLDLADRQHVLKRQRLEVEPVRRVVVGRDGLWVAVDHHRVTPGLTDRLRGMHAAVVELDPLADPVGPRAEDHDARTVAAVDLVSRGAVGGRTLPAGVEVRGLRGELGGAGVNRLIGPLTGERRVRIGRQLGELVQEPRVDVGAPVELLHRGAAPQRLKHMVEPLRAGSAVSASSVSSSSGCCGGVSSSRERSALANACWKVRPSAIASPTDFMWVVSPPSAPGNFSNANRGHLTTQ